MPHVRGRTGLNVVTVISYLGKNKFATWRFNPCHGFMLYLLGHRHQIHFSSDQRTVGRLWLLATNLATSSISWATGLCTSYRNYLLSFWRSQKVFGSRVAGCFQGKISDALRRRMREAWNMLKFWILSFHLAFIFLHFSQEGEERGKKYLSALSIRPWAHTFL